MNDIAGLASDASAQRSPTPGQSGSGVEATLAMIIEAVPLIVAAIGLVAMSRPRDDGQDPPHPALSPGGEGGGAT